MRIDGEELVSTGRAAPVGRDDAEIQKRVSNSSAHQLKETVISTGTYSSKFSEPLVKGKFFWFFYPTFLFLVGFEYAYGLIAFGSFLDHFVTVVFCLALLYGFYRAYRVINGFSDGDGSQKVRIGIFAGGVAVNLGVLVGFALANAPPDTLWVPDSYEMHLPGAKNFSDFLSGTSELRERSSIFDRIYFAHVVVGVFFFLFGVSPLVSGLALLLGKLGAMLGCYWLGKMLFDERRALLAVLAYSLMPTVVFYTASFYKEAFVQLFVGLALTGLYGILIQRRPAWIWPFFVAIFILANERFYLFPIFLGTFGLAAIISSKTAKWIRFGAPIIILAGSSWYFNQYKDYVNVFHLIGELDGFRQAYNAYSDVDRSWNSELAYPLALVKFLLTPFFTARKFDLFYDFSHLITWGSFFNQVVVVAAVGGVGFALRRRFGSVWFLLLPALIFFAVFAYVAPYSGRIRDSFYVLIAVFAADSFERLRVWWSSRKCRDALKGS